MVIITNNTTDGIKEYAYEIIEYSYAKHINHRMFKEHNQDFICNIIREARSKVVDFEPRPDDYYANQIWRITNEDEDSVCVILTHVFINYHFNYIQFIIHKQMIDSKGIFHNDNNEKYIYIDYTEERF